jgi:competence protein ComEC
LLAGPAERLQRQGVWTQLRVQRWRLLQRPATPIADLRRRMAAALLQAGGPAAGGVLAALVLGSAVVPLPLEVRDAFRASGLSHALAASGFHLTVLLGAVMALGRLAPRPLRWLLAFGAMGLFLLLAGPQPSVVRAVLMGALAFALQEARRHPRPLGVLLVCVVLVLAVRPGWLLDVGFQLSVAATAGLLLSARPQEQWLAGWLPGWLAAAVAVPLAASLWTLPLQLLHFGALPLYTVPANLLVAPLLTPLTLGAMAMAVAAVLLPPALPLLGWPLVALTRLLLWLVTQLAALPLAQLQLGRCPPALVALLALGLLPWLVPRWWQRRAWGALLVGAAMGSHLLLLRGDHLLALREGPRQWLLARHGGRGALVSRRADPLSCSRARQLAQAHGLQRLDWVLLLDPVPPEQPACWAALARTLLNSQNGTPPLLVGQRLQSPGLQVEIVAQGGQALQLQVGTQRWGLLPDRQAWRAWRDGLQRPPALAGLWLGFTPEGGLQRELRRRLPALPPSRLWWPVAGSRSGWRQS